MSGSSQRRRQAIVSAIGLVVIAAVMLTTWLLNDEHSDTTDPASASAPTAESLAPSPSRANVPTRVTRTLALIDTGQWPDAAHAPGTRGGITFRNSERHLPATGSHGARITYREWDVNPKRAGHSRDAERIVTGSDGSAWYTNDHYQSFIRIRGPNQ